MLSFRVDEAIAKKVGVQTILDFLWDVNVPTELFNALSCELVPPTSTTTMIGISTPQKKASSHLKFPKQAKERL